MPKQKTRSAAKKRFKVTATGKIMRLPTMRSHNLEHKPSSKKRKFDKNVEIAGADYKALKQMLRIK